MFSTTSCCGALSVETMLGGGEAKGTSTHVGKEDGRQRKTEHPKNTQRTNQNGTNADLHHVDGIT